MAYVIPSKRAKAMAKAARKAQVETTDMFPALCPGKASAPALDFTQISFEDEIEPIQERRFEPGWARLSFQGLVLRVETDYYPHEPTLDELAGKAILDMKTRWIKFYTDRGEVPYDYDYIPPEPEEEEYWTESSSDEESAEYFSE
jgi:hypothetical protein